MKLNIYSLKNTLFSGDVTSLGCTTASGDITVLDHHRPLISMLKECTLTVTDSENKDHFIPIYSGFLEVNGANETRVLVEERPLH